MLTEQVTRLAEAVAAIRQPPQQQLLEPRPAPPLLQASVPQPVLPLPALAPVPVPVAQPALPLPFLPAPATSRLRTSTLTDRGHRLVTWRLMGAWTTVVVRQRRRRRLARSPVRQRGRHVLVHRNARSPVRQRGRHVLVHRNDDVDRSLRMPGSPVTPVVRAPEIPPTAGVVPALALALARAHHAVGQ